MTNNRQVANNLLAVRYQQGRNLLVSYPTLATLALTTVYDLHSYISMQISAIIGGKLLANYLRDRL